MGGSGQFADYLGNSTSCVSSPAMIDVDIGNSPDCLAMLNVGCGVRHILEEVYMAIHLHSQAKSLVLSAHHIYIVADKTTIACTSPVSHFAVMKQTVLLT